MNRPLASRRSFLAAAGAAAVAGCAPAQTVRPQRLRLIGEATLPHRMQFRGTTVGGLSGLDFDPVRDLWYSISDDRSDFAPARFYTLRLAVSADALGTPRLQEVVTLRQANGLPYPNRRQGGDVPDPEAIRWRPRTGTLLWTSEGDAGLGLDPFVREVRADGSHVRELASLPMLRMDALRQSGPRDNLAFEGLALTPDGMGAWVAMESSLLQDGPVPGVGIAGGPCRFTLFDLESGRPVRQIAYLPDAVPRAPLVPGTFADNGVSEILMIDARRMLVLERSYALGAGNSLRLYLIDTQEGGNTMDVAVLRAGDFRAPAKTLVLDFDALGLSRLDNTEAMAWGPRLPNGNRTLVFTSDDNFNPAQVTQFVACELLDQTLNP
jgi:hypothetical protein